MATDVLSVRCRACVGVETIEPATVARGWYRCSYCGTANATPESTLEACEGPEAHVLVLRGPEQVRFILPPGNVMRPATLLLVADSVRPLGDHRVIIPAARRSPTPTQKRTKPRKCRVSFWCAM